MEEKLYTGQIAIDQLGDLIADCQFPEDRNTWVLAEQIPDRAIANRKDPAERQKMLLYKYFRQNIPFFDYSSGRIFRENMEIRWEKQDGAMRVVYLGTDKYTPVLHNYKLREDQHVLTTTWAKPKSYYLFGERLKEEDLRYMDKTATPEVRDNQFPTTKHFAQVRIPHLLLYPVKHCSEPYVCLKVCEYINKETGIVELFRFQKLEPAEEEEEKQHESI